MKETLKKIAVSKKWWYFGRNFSTPKWNTIAIKGFAEQGEFANAADVFAEMKLDLGKLSQIFVKKPHEYYNLKKKLRSVQPIAKSYHSLGVCRAWDDEGWRQLAILAGKIIHFIHCHGEPTGEETKVFYPSGKIRRTKDPE